MLKMLENNDICLVLEQDASGNNVIKHKCRYLHSDSCQNTKEDIEMMKYKLEHYPDCWLNEDKHNNINIELELVYDINTPIKHAAVMDHINCFKFLISILKDKEGFKINSDLLHICLAEQKFKIVKYILKNKLVDPVRDINKLDNVFCRINKSNHNLYLAIMCKHKLSSIKLILDQGVKVDDPSNFNNPKIKNRTSFVSSIPTHCAIRFYPEALMLLLFYGGILDHRQVGRDDLSDELKDSLSLIQTLASTTNIDDPEISLQILNILYEFGANLWEKNQFGLTPLDIKIQLASEDIKGEMEIISAKMLEFMSKPLSLKSLCRISILRSKSSDYLNYVDNELQNILPEEIIDFLNGKDVVSSAAYHDFDDSSDDED